LYHTKFLDTSAKLFFPRSFVEISYALNYAHVRMYLLLAIEISEIYVCARSRRFHRSDDAMRKSRKAILLPAASVLRSAEVLLRQCYIKCLTFSRYLSYYVHRMHTWKIHNAPLSFNTRCNCLSVYYNR